MCCDSVIDSSCIVGGWFISTFSEKMVDQMNYYLDLYAKTTMWLSIKCHSFYRPTEYFRGNGWQLIMQGSMETLAGWADWVLYNSYKPIDYITFCEDTGFSLHCMWLSSLSWLWVYDDLSIVCLAFTPWHIPELHFQITGLHCGPITITIITTCTFRQTYDVIFLWILSKP